MKKYVKLIKPIMIYPDSHYKPISEDLEDQWYPEEKMDELKNKYIHLESTFEKISFDTKYVELEE